MCEYRERGNKEMDEMIYLPYHQQPIGLKHTLVWAPFCLETARTKSHDYHMTKVCQVMFYNGPTYNTL